MKAILVVDQPKDWQGILANIKIVSSQDYFTSPRYQYRSFKVFNLCKSYQYQSAGYYVSLLAAARGQKVIPTVSTILDMKSRDLLKLRSKELDTLIQRNLKDLQSEQFELSIYFGRNVAKKYEKLSFELHKNFNAPLLRASFRKKDKWQLNHIHPISLTDVPASHFDLLAEYAGQYFEKRLTTSRTKTARFDLAILVNPDEEHPPSNARALQNFETAARKLEIDVEFLTKDDYHRISEFDGLFIRETTAVNHHTYKFAHKAQSLGLAVIDDPLSILRCTNKVYLAELFLRNKIPAPKTSFIYRKHVSSQIKRIELPAVLKVPDSAFSRGVVKVQTQDELKLRLDEMLEDSDIALAQEYLPTSFDWRVGILDGQPLYACKYFMARNHWQIYRQKESGKSECGNAETFNISDVPKHVVDLAVRASNLIGQGLYGVDIKEVDSRAYVIEVNDNPSIDASVEDEILGSALYDYVMRSLMHRMERIALGTPHERI